MEPVAAAPSRDTSDLAVRQVEAALADAPQYTLDVGPYRYAVTQGDTVTVRCVHIPSGVVAEADAPIQHDARMAARARVDEIRAQERI
jgi:hypothetical protein